MDQLGDGDADVISPAENPLHKVSERIIFIEKTVAMSASSETYEDLVQIVENLIGSDLIDNVVAELQSAKAQAETDIVTKMAWTPACEKLREFYMTNVHSKVVTQPKIASIVTPPAETAAFFKMIEGVNLTFQNHPIRRIRLPTDYHVLIPVVIEGLPRWIEVLSINERREVPWAKGSLVYLKGGTDLICSREGGGVYILMGGRKKTIN
ncbi:MAG: hypothetical protein L6R35_001826 [Caloplaca aegaea]|nr:MAG: hypothetical protein L6R35_001826 [Caloplaca aegaea]